MIVLETLILILVTLVPLLVAIAFFTLAERKIIASIQRRQGPNVVGGFFGLLQPFADGLKALLKETIFPAKGLKFIYVLAPLLTLTFSLFNWVIIPLGFDDSLVEFNLSIFFSLVVLSLNAYGIILAGLASNSKYAFLGTIRTLAQILAYEVVLSFLILPCIILAGSFNLADVVFSQSGCWNVFPLFPLAFMFLVVGLAETNRTPFDLPEAEAELVAGYNVEYSGILFAFFF
jgi:NADH-quinone oxidoreductase subunit H